MPMELVKSNGWQVNLASLEELAGHLQVLDEVGQRRRRRRTLTGSAFIK